MNASAAQQTLFAELAVGLPEQQKAEFFRNLHEAGISPGDVELVRLLRALQLYKAYYETIPKAVEAAASQIEKLKQDIEQLSAGAGRSAETCNRIAGDVAKQSEVVRQDLLKIHEQAQAATRESAANLASKTAELLRENIGKTVFEPMQGSLAELATANLAFDDAIAKNNQAAEALSKSATVARRAHLGIYMLGAALLACILSATSWYFLDRWYEGSLEKERAALVQRVESNRAVLLKLAESNRTLELIRDPDNPRRSLLVMKDASCWQSTRNHGVIEFTR